MSEIPKKTVQLIRGILYTGTGSTEKLIITKKGVIYLKSLKNKKRK